MASPADIVIYGGSAGSGKSWAILLEPLRHVTTNKEFAAVCFRRNTTQILALIDMLDRFGGLTAFVAALARNDDAPPCLGQLHRIMTRAESAWIGAPALP